MERGKTCRFFPRAPSPMRSSIAWSACVANVRETLRRYLEQRIELGEHAIVLETLAATDVIKTARVDNAGRDTTPSPGASSVPLADWRTALQESGAAPPVEKADRPALPSFDSLAAIEAAVASCTL